MLLKIDWDGPFRDWLRLFRAQYAYLRASEMMLVSEVRVARTAHGWHIYIGCCEDQQDDPLAVNVLECLLGSDVRKQVYFYVEGNDILFKRKKGVAERSAPRQAGQLADAVAWVHDHPQFYRKFTFRA
jgi:hypothetical protein